MGELDIQKAVAIVEALAELCDIDSVDIVKELIGVCWSEEEAGDIEQELS